MPSNSPPYVNMAIILALALDYRVWGTGLLAALRKSSGGRGGETGGRAVAALGKATGFA